MKAFVYGEFNGEISSGSDTLESPKRNRIISIKSENNTIEFKYAISFISAEQAERNLAEISGRSFEEVKESAEQAWDEKLSQIQVSGRY